jgi:beta-glucanase (GH16 family)
MEEDMVKRFSNMSIGRFLLSGLMFAMTIIAIQGICSSSHAATGGWQYSWSDEFPGPAVDTTVWGYEIGYVRNNEAQYYSNRSENSRIENGMLHIQALRDNWSGHQYTSASRTTKGKKTWQYGKFEMRAKIDIRTGSWPAWWMYSTTNGWPKGGEIDMMEFYTQTCLFNVMNGNGAWAAPRFTITSLGGARWATYFHIWTMEWDTTRIDLLLDGKLMNHYPMSNADGTGPNGTNPFKYPFPMILNQAIGGSSGGDPTNTPFPVDYWIDFIRVSTWSNATSYALRVDSGVGSGSYIPGTRVTIAAKMPPVTKMFDKWVIVSGNPTITAIDSPSTILTMPSANANVIATYKSTSTSINDPVCLARKSSGASSVRLFDIRGRAIHEYAAGSNRIRVCLGKSGSASAYLIVDR